MKNRRILSTVLVFLLLIGTVSSLILPASAEKIITDKTGYKNADDVEYMFFTSSGKKVVANWGARGEDAVFLTTYAVAYYTGNYSKENIFDNNGGTGTSNVTSSDLFKELAKMLKAKHSHVTNYQETRYLYCYTDCLRNNTAKISSFYSGKTISGTWDSGKTWNREHTWPNSKGAGKTGPGADIMMLRPTSVSENSSRGNTAYGESSGYYDPGESVRGDCARIILYTYVRWNSNVNSYVWGKSGVIENLDVLLKWMAEDPVDTWEMGRNDSVQSITGVRNVFVDYPELAWKLFGKEVPAGIVTPTSQTGGTINPATTETPTTEAPTTEAPTTETPTTKTPTTETPTTETPTTEAPTTETPTTETPTTETPTTDAPTTDSPTTDAPTTEASGTEVPTTEAITTNTPTTDPQTSDSSVSSTPETTSGHNESSNSGTGETTNKPSEPSNSETTETLSPPSSSDTEANVSEEGKDWIIWIVVIAVVAVGATVAIVIIVGKRKNDM